MSETRAEKFHRLAEKRVPKAGDAIRLVGQLSSNNYESQKEEAQAIVDYLQGQVDDLRANFKLEPLVLAKAPEPMTVNDAEAGNPPEAE